MGQFAPFQEAKGRVGPDVMHFDLKSDAAFNIGAPVKRHSTATQILEFGGGTDVTGLLGFALVGAASGLPAAKGTYAYGTKVPIYKAREGGSYIGQLVSGDSDTIVTPAASNLRTYGIIKSTATGNWYIDVSETTSLILTVTKIYIDLKFVEFELISTVIGA